MKVWKLKKFLSTRRGDEDIVLFTNTADEKFYNLESVAEFAEKNGKNSLVILGTYDAIHAFNTFWEKLSAEAAKQNIQGGEQCK